MGWHLDGQEPREQLFPFPCRATGRDRDTEAAGAAGSVGRMGELFCGVAKSWRGQVPRSQLGPPAGLQPTSMKEFSKHNVGRGAWGMDVHEGITPGKHPIVVEPSVPQAVGG